MKHYLKDNFKKKLSILIILILIAVALLSVYFLNNRTSVSTEKSEAAILDCLNSGYISTCNIDNLPWGKQSFYLQPWRGYLETVPAQQMLDGNGVNFSDINIDYGSSTDILSAKLDKLVSILSQSGIKTIRIEIPWTNVKWDETGFDGKANYFRLSLAAFKKYGVKPVILLNANSIIPGPNQYLGKRTVNGTQGQSTATISSTTGIVTKSGGINTNGYTGLSYVTGNPRLMGDVFITGISGNTITLSKPLPRSLNNENVDVHTMKYLPLFPLGTAENTQTMNGWLKYVSLVKDLTFQAGLANSDFEMEIWNELTFGSEYLNAGVYFASQKPWFDSHNALLSGGQMWDLGDKTTQYIRQNLSGTKVIWGFSNTTFYHTPITSLPSGTNGQSYHPYGTGLHIVGDNQYQEVENFGRYIEGFIPRGLHTVMPEGWAQLGVKTEFLERLLDPRVRLTTKPSGITGTFEHYITEHASMPGEANITDPTVALNYKAKALIRYNLFWLNKGISKIHHFNTYLGADTNQGLLFNNTDVNNILNLTTAQIMTPAMTALQRTTSRFAGATTISSPRSLGLSIVSTDAASQIAFNGDATHPNMYYKDMYTFLPFQVTNNKFVIGSYVMSYDITNPPPVMNFTIKINNVNGTASSVSYYDPITNTNEPVTVVAKDSTSITVSIANKDYPRLLTIDENGTPVPTVVPTNTSVPTTIVPIKTSTPTPIPTTTIQPSNTATIQPTNIACAPETTSNVCNSSCTFNKMSGISYGVNGDGKIVYVRESNLGSTPTSTDIQNYCNRPNRTKGDADGLNGIDPTDYLYYVRVVNGGKVPSWVNTDFNGDGSTTRGDRDIVVANLQ